MLVELSVPYADVRAGDLALTLDAPPEPALDRLACVVGGVELELRLLGCSHQALAGGGALVSEMVACRPGAPAGLPARHDRPGYRFAARVERLSPAAFATRARAVIEAASADPAGLVGVFPGPGPAFTALRARPAPARDGGPGAAWSTWHAYPQTGELVVTESVLRPGVA